MYSDRTDEGVPKLSKSKEGIERHLHMQGRHIRIHNAHPRTQMEKSSMAHAHRHKGKLTPTHFFTKPHPLNTQRQMTRTRTHNEFAPPTHPLSHRGTYAHTSLTHVIDRQRERETHRDTETQRQRQRQRQRGEGGKGQAA